MSEITAKVGRIETGEDLTLSFSMAAHTALQGSTRSGKSVLTYGILTRLNRLPCVEIWGLDPTGVLLSPWEHTGRVALGEDVGAFVSVLEELVKEMDRRIREEIRAKKTDKVEEFTNDLPLIVLVLEELPGIIAAIEEADAAEGLKPADRRKPKVLRLIGRVLRESAKAGIRVLAIAQRFEADLLGGGVRSQFATMITMRVPDAAAVRMLHQDVPDDLAALVPQFSPGVGLIEFPGLPLCRFKAAYLTYQRYLEINWKREHLG